jgi:hypothetical protein
MLDATKMEMERTVQQMMELLLARINASMKEHIQEMKADRKANQAKANANQEDMLTRMEETNANQEKVEGSTSTSMRSNQDLLSRLEARIETNREKDQEDLKEMREEIKSGQAEMRSTIRLFRSELNETCNMQ